VLIQQRYQSHSGRWLGGDIERFVDVMVFSYTGGDADTAVLL
jgi:hypothetical protein